MEKNHSYQSHQSYQSYESYQSYSAVKSGPAIQYLPENPPPFNHNATLLSPQPHAKSRNRLSPFKLAADAFAIIVPLALLGFLAAVCRLHGQPVDEGRFAAWRNAIAVLATVFTIIFASIVGRLTYEAARWRLEAGATLTSLEQLLGSRSVGATITTQMHLWSFNILGASLLVTWAFSPLGSQAILRSLGSRLDTRTSTTDIAWFDNLHQSGFADWRPSSPASFEAYQTWMMYLGLLFSTSVMTPEATKLEPMDQWGNVKIPYLVDTSNKEWRETKSDASFEHFSSLAGFPVANVPVGNSSLTIESSYIELDCASITVTRGKLPDQVEVHWDWQYDSFNTSIPANGTWQGTTSPSDSPSPMWTLALDNFVDYYWVNQTEQQARREKLGDPKALAGVSYPDYISFDNSPERFLEEPGIQANPTRLLIQANLATQAMTPPDGLAATCAVHQRYVESRITCERRSASSWVRNCSVTAQRPSQQPHPTKMISHLNFPSVWSLISNRLARVAGAGGEAKRPDMVMQYLNDPALLSMSMSDSTMYFEEVDKTAFGRRLGQVINTYVLLSQVFLAAPGANQGAVPMSRNVTAPVEATTLVEVYAVSWPWTVLGFVACGVLLAAGVAGVVLRHMAAGPEVLGYASTVVRDSKFVEVPSRLADMDGLDVSKKVGAQRMRYGVTDVMAEGRPLIGVGRVEETARLRLTAGKGDGGSL